MWVKSVGALGGVVVVGAANRCSNDGVILESKPGGSSWARLCGLGSPVVSKDSFVELGGSTHQSRCSVLFLGVVRSAESRVRWQPLKPVKTLRTKHQNIVKIRRNIVKIRRNIVKIRRNVVEKRRNS